MIDVVVFGILGLFVLLIVVAFVQVIRGRGQSWSAPLPPLGVDGVLAADDDLGLPWQRRTLVGIRDRLRFVQAELPEQVPLGVRSALEEALIGTDGLLREVRVDGGR